MTDKQPPATEAASLPGQRDHAGAFYIRVTVGQDDLDDLGHVNNVTYLRWLEQAAWAHSESVELDWVAYRRLNTACVVRRHELDYLAATFVGERLAVATWIIENDGRLTLWRGFRILRLDDMRTVMRARSRFVCIRLDNGRPCRMPPEFRERYAPSDGVG